MNDLKKKKTATIEELARMVQRGFEEFGKRFDQMDLRFDRLERRFDRMEKVVLPDHGRRIKRLEADVEYIKDGLAIK